MNKIFLLSMFALLMGACSTSTKNSCNNNDWKEIGKESGRKGEAADVVMKDQKKCEKLGIDIPLNAYKDGWLEGIDQYCSESNAFELGQDGDKHTVENCPIELQPAFQASYDKGLKLKEVNKELESVESKIGSVDSKKEKLKDEIEEKRKEINALENKQSDLRSQKENILQENTQN